MVFKGDKAESLFDVVPANLNSTKIMLEKGEVLFQQGSPVVCFYIIKSGGVKLTRMTIEGSLVVVHVAYTGETIAEASLFSSVYHCSAVADCKVEIDAIKKSDLLHYLEQRPAVMMQLMMQLAHQVRALRTISEIKNIRSAKERVLAFIKSEMNDNGEFNFSLSLKDTAHQIGLAHETFYRVLKQLEDKDEIERKDKHIKLHQAP